MQARRPVTGPVFRAFVVACAAILAFLAFIAILLAFPSSRAVVARGAVFTYLWSKGLHLDRLDLAIGGGIMDARDIAVSEDGRPFFSADELRATYGARGRALGIASIRLVGPRLTVRRQEDGSYDIARLIGGGGAHANASSPMRMSVDVVGGSIDVLNEFAPSPQGRAIALRSVGAHVDVDQGARSSGQMSAVLTDVRRTSALNLSYDENDAGHIARARIVIRGAPIASVIDLLVSNSAFVVQNGTADLALDGYAAGWDASAGPQWRFVGSGSIRDGVLRTLPLSVPVVGVAGRLSVFDGTLEFEGLHGSAAGVPLVAAGSVELFPDLALGLRVGAAGSLARVRTWLPFSSKLPLKGSVGIAASVDGTPVSPHVDVALQAIKRVWYRDVPIDGFGALVYYHDGHVALQRLGATYAGARLSGYGDIDLTASPAAGQFVALADAQSKRVPWIANLEPAGRSRAKIVLYGPLMKLSGGGFLSSSDGADRVRAEVQVAADHLGATALLRDAHGGELVASGALDRSGDRPLTADLIAHNYHANVRRATTTLPGLHARPAQLPSASALLNGYAVLRGTERAPAGAIRIAGRQVAVGGHSIGRTTIDAAGTADAFRIARFAVDGPLLQLESDGIARARPTARGGTEVVGAFEGTARADLADAGRPDLARGLADADFDAALRGGDWTAAIDTRAPARPVTISGVPISDLRAVVGGRGTDLTVYAASAAAAGGRIDIQGHVPGTSPGWLTVSVRGVDLAAQRAMALPITGGSVVAIATIAGTARELRASGAAALAGSAYRGLPLAGDLQADYRAGTLSVHGARVIGENSVAIADGSIGGLRSGVPTLALSASVPEADLGALGDTFAPSVPGVSGVASAEMRADGALGDPTISGSFSASTGTVRGVDFTGLHATLSANRDALAIDQGGVAFGTSRLAVTGRLSRAGVAVRASSRRVDLGDFNDFFGGKDVLEGRAALDIAMSNIAGDRDASGRFTVADARIEGVPLGALNGDITPRGEDVAISVRQNGALGNSTIDAIVPPQAGTIPRATVTANLRSLDLAAISPYVALEDQRLAGIAHARIVASTGSAGMRANGSFGVDRGSVRGIALKTLSGSVAYDRGSVNVRALRVGIDGAQAQAAGTIDRAHRVRARATAHVDDLAKLERFANHPVPMSGAANAAVEVAGPLEQPDIVASLNAANGHIRDVAFDSVGVDARYSRGAVLGNGSIALADGHGTIGFKGDVPIRTRPFAIGPNDRAVSFDAQLAGVGLAAVNPLLGDRLTLHGILNGTMHVSGTAGKPSVAGSMQLRQTSIGSKYDRVPVSELRADLSFNNDRIDLQHVHGTVGGGTIDMRGSAHVVPATAIVRHANLQYAFGAQLHGADIDVPDVLTGNVDAQLGFTKSGSVPYLYGGIQFTRTSVPFATILALATTHSSSSGGGSNIPGLPALRPHHFIVYGGSVFGDDLDHVVRPTPRPTPPPAIAVVPQRIALGLHVVAGQDVGVTGPLSVTGTGAVDVSGDTSAPSLDGTLTAVRGRAGFLNTNFNLLDGRLIFTKNQGLLPDISADATTRTEDADITVSTYGRVDQLHTDLESDPPMTRDAIIATLLHIPQINSALATSHGMQQSSFGVSPQNLVSGAIAGQILGALNIGLEQVFNLEEVDFGLDPFGRPILEVRKQVSPRAYTLYRTTFSVPPAQALGIAYQVRRALQIELTQSQTTPGILGTYAVPQTSLLVRLTFH